MPSRFNSFGSIPLYDSSSYLSESTWFCKRERETEREREGGREGGREGRKEGRVGGGEIER